MYLGLDLGTSGLRGILVDDAGSVAGSAESNILTSSSKPGWSEQSPLDWVEACKEVVGQLRAAHGTAFSALRGIGLSGHMHGATLLDANCNVLRPCILWNDTRASKEAEILDQLPGMRSSSGNIVFPGFTAPKLEWVRENEPDLFAKIAKVLLPKDYLRLWLTGDYVSDMSDSAGTSWLDVGARRWSETALEQSHMSIEQMPRLVEGSDPGGELRSELQQEWGSAGAGHDCRRSRRQRCCCLWDRQYKRRNWLLVPRNLRCAAGVQGHLCSSARNGGTLFLSFCP